MSFSLIVFALSVFNAAELEPSGGLDVRTGNNPEKPSPRIMLLAHASLNLVDRAVMYIRDEKDQLDQDDFSYALYRMAAFSRPGTEMADVLISSGADVNAVGGTDENDRVASEMIRWNRPELLIHLIDHDVELRYNGTTALHTATRYGKTHLQTPDERKRMRKVLDILRSHGISPATLNDEGTTPAHYRADDLDAGFFAMLRPQELQELATVREAGTENFPIETATIKAYEEFEYIRDFDHRQPVELPGVLKRYFFIYDKLAPYQPLQMHWKPSDDFIEAVRAHGRADIAKRLANPVRAEAD